jgi:ABC-2 type transport system permease protein
MFPLTTLLFMNIFMQNPTDEIIIKLIAGNMVFAIIVSGMDAMSQEISWQKHQGHFVFYASLPISKINFVIANLLRGFMSTFPSVVILAAIGQWVYDVPFHYSWGLIPIIFLSIMSVVGIGVMLGFWSPNHQMLNMLSQFLMMIVSFLTPVFVDMHQLPKVMQWVSYVLPTTYAAESLKLLLLSGWDREVSVNMVIMLFFAIGSFLIINRLVHWRVNT